jgi:hypothetical protein
MIDSCPSSQDFFFNNEIQYVDKDLLTYQDPQYVRCYRFNSGRNKTGEIIPELRNPNETDGNMVSLLNSIQIQA